MENSNWFYVYGYFRQTVDILICKSVQISTKGGNN
jgi:hypothetical protein